MTIRFDANGIWSVEKAIAALRALAPDVDTTRMPRAEWRKRNEAAGIGVF